MEYQNIDEAARREACEKVKQIVKAIKAIKIKYYLNFSKISEEDRQAYDILEANLEKISKRHNIENLKIALMEEVLNKYDRDNNIQNERQLFGNSNDPDKIKEACLGAIDVEKEAVKQFKLKQAIKCQKILNEYMEKIESESTRDIINEYRRKKFEELAQSRSEIDKKNKEFLAKAKRSYQKINNPLKKEEATNVIQECTIRKEQTKQTKENEQTV